MHLNERIPGPLIAAAMLLIALTAQAAPGPAIPEGKKLLAFASNTVEPSYLRKHIADLEKLPLDGMVISVYADGWKGGRSGQEDRWFSGAALRREDFRQAVDDLKATPFRRFTDNFINFSTTVRTSPPPGTSADDPTLERNLDWFDPAWSGIAANAAVAAWIAHEAGFKGLFLDVEPYGGGRGIWRYPFDYQRYAAYAKESGQQLRTLEECIAQVRQRGREMMAAMAAVYPDITIVVIPNMTASELTEAFVQGMNDRRGRATLIDGGEGAYPSITHAEFVGARQQAESAHQRAGLSGSVECALGLWIDVNPDQYGGWRSEPTDFHANYRSPADLENSLYAALTVADRYVWLFVWHPDVWWTPVDPPRRMDQQCKRCPHERVPTAYLNALKNCRQPHDLDWSPAAAAGRFVWIDDVVLVEGTKIVEGATNLLKNGGMENWQTADASPADWIASGQGIAIVKDDARRKSGNYAARLTTMHPRGHVMIDHTLSAAPHAGKDVTLGAWVWSDMPEVGDAQILDFVDGRHEVASSAGHPGDGQWHLLTVTKTIRPSATGDFKLRVGATVPYLPGGARAAGR